MDNSKRKFQGSYLKTWSYLKASEIKKNSCRISIFAEYCVVYNVINSFLLATGVAVQKCSEECLFCITLQNSHLKLRFIRYFFFRSAIFEETPGNYYLHLRYTCQFQIIGRGSLNKRGSRQIN